ncbi:hypothetical protein [Streptomyces sp. HUAS TT7]|uniref:hypothetical protein n=1 Tax=Streptomyces sp. HUAS TT7 TaxID=3447507 RepID=UPI003F65A703
MSWTTSRTDSFIPKIWSEAVRFGYDASTVFSSRLVSNRDYEGDIKSYGDTVKINTVSTPAVQKYTPFTKLKDEDISTSSVDLSIDQSDAWMFKVDDVITAQQRGSLAAGSTAKEGRKLAVAADLYMSGLITASKDVDKTTALALNKTENPGEQIYTGGILELSQKLDDNLIPNNGRYLVVSPRIKKYLLHSPRFTAADAYGSTDPIRNGIIGRIAGFTVAVTTLMPKGADIVAGHTDGLTIADQLVKTEATREPQGFFDYVKGLHLYGGLLLEPKAIVTATVADPVKN